MTINEIEFNHDDLMSAEELKAFLEENGEDDKALSKIRDQQYEKYDAELIWRYPISDSLHLGTYLVPVKEGILNLPYNAIDESDGELLELSDATLHTAESLQFLLDDWKSFSDDLISAMQTMIAMLEKEGDNENGI